MILRGLTGGADDRRLYWSPGPRSEADPRHHGVRDVVAWSYELCSDKERLLFDRLSVFAAGDDTNPEDSHGADDAAASMGTDLDAIETICSDDTSETDMNSHTGAGLARQEIEGLLERLVNHSLVTVHITPTTVRYSLLESLRVFAQQRLRERSVDEVDEPARLARRHRRHYRDKVVFAAANWFGPAEQDLLDWARAEWDNILTAIETSITTPGEAAVGLEICTGLFALRVPFYTGAFRELRQWTGRCLQATRASTPQPTELQMVAMALIAGIAVHKGEHEDAERMLEDCIAACIPDPDSRRDWRHTPETDIGLPAPAELAWGMELIFAHRNVRAIGVLARAREKFHHLGDHGAEAVSDLWAGFAAGLLGTAQQAHEAARRSLDRANASGASLLISWAELSWAITLTKHGNPTEALEVERRALAYLLPCVTGGARRGRCSSEPGHWHRSSPTRSPPENSTAIRSLRWLPKLPNLAAEPKPNWPGSASTSRNWVPSPTNPPKPSLLPARYSAPRRSLRKKPEARGYIPNTTRWNDSHWGHCPSEKHRTTRPAEKTSPHTGSC